MQEVLKNNATLAYALKICMTKKVHFAAYKLPGDSEVTIIIHTRSVSPVIPEMNGNLPEKGFLIAPFIKENNNAFLIRPDMVLRDHISTSQISELESLPDRNPYNSETACPQDTQKDEYLQLVRDSIKKIKAGEFEKVVLSRVKTFRGRFLTHLEDVFYELCNSYINAFVYLFCVNGECWTGATPEPFICSRDNELRTVSLASTRAFNEKDFTIDNWNRKEMLEQKYVTMHIEKTLDACNIHNYIQNGPYVAKAGNLLHLRTDFVFPKTAVGNRLASLINALHPTPAICGMSTGKALDFINRVEKHNREYYTGYLGPVGIDDDLQLFVNLRCLKVYPDCVVLYMGGGITSDSQPEEEWRETDIKADTLLSVLRQF